MSRKRTGMFPYEYMGKFEKEVLNSEAGKMRSRYKGFIENKHLLENRNIQNSKISGLSKF